MGSTTHTFLDKERVDSKPTSITDNIRRAPGSWASNLTAMLQQDDLQECLGCCHCTVSVGTGALSPTAQPVQAGEVGSVVESLGRGERGAGGVHELHPGQQVTHTELTAATQGVIGNAILAIERVYITVVESIS